MAQKSPILFQSSPGDSGDRTVMLDSKACADVAATTSAVSAESAKLERITEIPSYAPIKLLRIINRIAGLHPAGFNDKSWFGPKSNSA
jgi:hypothetical protein